MTNPATSSATAPAATTSPATTSPATTPLTAFSESDIAATTPSSSRQAAGQTVESKGFSVASLVLGIASLVFGYTVVVPIVGLVLGILGLKREPSSKAMAWWGIVLNGLTLLGGALAVVFGLSALAVFGLADAANWVFPPVR